MTPEEASGVRMRLRETEGKNGAAEDSRDIPKVSWPFVKGNLLTRTSTFVMLPSEKI